MRTKAEDDRECGGRGAVLNKVIREHLRYFRKELEMPCGCLGEGYFSQKELDM